MEQTLTSEFFLALDDIRINSNGAITIGNLCCNVVFNLKQNDCDFITTFLPFSTFYNFASILLTLNLAPSENSTKCRLSVTLCSGRKDCKN